MNINNCNPIGKTGFSICSDTSGNKFVQTYNDIQISSSNDQKSIEKVIFNLNYLNLLPYGNQDPFHRTEPWRTIINSSTLCTNGKDTVSKLSEQIGHFQYPSPENKSTYPGFLVSMSETLAAVDDVCKFGLNVREKLEPNIFFPNAKLYNQH